MRAIWQSLAVLGVWVAASSALAQIEIGDPEVTAPGLKDFTCPSASIFSEKMLTSVCWDCMFPIRIAGIEIDLSDHNAPKGKARQSFCFCKGCGLIGKFGVTVGMWQPTHLIEQVRTPYCFPSLGGITLPSFSPSAQSIQVGNHHRREHSIAGSELSFSHFHYFSYPLLALLGIMDVTGCSGGGVSSFDLLWMSETFPNWANDELSMFLNPEAALFSNVAAVLAEPIDCIAATAYKPVDELFWVAGCWGSNYPLSGFADGTDSAVGMASLRNSRALFMLHRIGMAKRTMGDDAVCKPQRAPIMPKSQYRMQHFWPLPENQGGLASFGGDGSKENPFGLNSFLPTCCHAIGADSGTWGEWRFKPGTGEDFVQMVWRWNDCCVGTCI